MCQLTLKNIQKSYGSTKVVHDFNLDIQDKEFVVLVGPSGCGKSTTLRMIAGLEDISAGELIKNETVINHLPPGDRGVAMVFQDYALYPHMTVFENMAFSLRLKKFKEEEIQSRVHQAAEMLDLTPYLQRKPAALSGGQRQRVAMGRAVVKRAEVFLFDEPLSNLDAKLRHKMRSEIKKFHQKSKTTTVYVTHDQLEAMTLADRLVVMKDGLVEQEGTPLEVFDFPKTKFVASFIGNPSMNFLNCSIEKEGEGYFIKDQANSFQLKLPEGKSKNLEDGQSVILGIRPSDVYLSHEDDHHKEWRVEGKVDIIELLGKNAFLSVNIGDEECISEVMGRELPREGETLHFTFNLDHIHLFDPKTEKNLHL
ncbi:MAG: ABC transporter ATP-binding protein [Bacteriovoracaceae bacterium]